MTIITNTGPLIALAKIDQLTLLQRLFESVSIPPAVQRELLAKSGPDADRLDTALHQFINVTTKPDLPAEVRVATDHLDDGERQAIALAYAEKTVLVIDERLGRYAARQLGITVTGSVGILIEAKQRGFIPAVVPLLQDIRHYGYWLSDNLVSIAAKLAGEIE
ncbi:MAG: DUF3368 domain-containing protein [Chloroflexi bacterium]|nr:DUF3368 domain-containing protein [Chloroflexota bacterium]